MTAAPRQPLVGTPPKVSDPRSLGSVVEAMFAALGTGDVAALVALAAPVERWQLGFACDETGPPVSGPRTLEVYRDQYRTIAQATKGLTIEVLEIAEPGVGSGDSPYAIKQGETYSSGCVATVDHVLEKQYLALIRVHRSAQPTHELTVSFKLSEVRGRWYVDSLPLEISERYAATRSYVTKMAELTARMCACKSRACAFEVNDEAMEWAYRQPSEFRPSERLQKEMAAKYGACVEQVGYDPP